MTDLKKVFEKAGYKNVRTVLASGNVIFATGDTDTKKISQAIVWGLKKAFKKDIIVIVRSEEDLKRMQKADPFKKIMVSPNIRRYVTFVSGEMKPRTAIIPYSSDDSGFRILAATPIDVFSIVDISRGKGTPDMMKFLEKEFGAEITTRNWNTVERILKIE